MSALRSLSLLMLITAMGAETLLTPAVHAQTNTQGRKPANPKATPPSKRGPIQRPVTPAPTNLTAPQLNETSWFSPETQENFYREKESKPHQLGGVATFNYFGSGGGVEYIYNIGLFGIGTSVLYTVADLKDKLDKIEAVESFETNSIYLRVHGRYNFFRYFYMGAGLSADRIKGTYGWKGSAINSGEIKTSFTSLMTMADVFVGSEFQGPWGTYIGMDWLGTSISMSKSVKSNKNPDLELTSVALKGSKPDQRISDEISAQVGIYYLNLRVGLAF